MRLARWSFLRCAAAWVACVGSVGGQTRIAILGDRTGEARAGVYEHILRAVEAERPAVVISVGDSIQGLNDATAGTEWREWKKLTEALPMRLAPGNHDVWSPVSQELYEKYSGRPLHYGFDTGPVHVTVLDNSRTEELSGEELRFAEEDLKAHAAQPIKIIVSHRPSWALHALVGDSDFPLHRVAQKYGVTYVIAGHVHQMLHYRVDGIDYISMPSAGGHLRDTGRYEDGWFFGYGLLEVTDGRTWFRIHETGGKVTTLEQWGTAGLRER